MNSNYLLTIAVPIYNGAGTVRDMMDILLPQVNEKIEIIVSDNCSTDSTPEIIKEYMLRYPMIRYIRNEENLGADGNFLQCVREAKGKFTMLISDDDIIMENAVSRIVNFLESNPDVSLAYMQTVGFKNKYVDSDHCHEFNVQSKRIEKNKVTTDKKEFFDYIRRQWGFTSSYLWNTERCQSIQNLDEYLNTYWMQSYIHILCSDREDDQLGLIAGDCIAAGEYGIIVNYDVAKIEGIYYRKMLELAIQKAGYDRKQLTDFWVWKVCYLGKRAIIKERSIGIKMSSVNIFYDVMKKYPYAWIHLFPYFLIPGFACKGIVKVINFLRGGQLKPRVNRI